MLVPYIRRNQNLDVFNPFRELAEMERSFFNDNGLRAFKTDIKDEGDHYLLEADLPGFEKNDIHLELKDNALTISAERHSEYEQKDKRGNYVSCERTYGSYTRSFDTTGIDTEKIKAAYDNGVLKLTLPKQAEPQSTSRRLEIE